MLQFVREIPIRIVIQKTLSQRRGFLFYVAVGFSHPVDPLSGMAVSLLEVDRWLASLKRHLEDKTFETDRESLNSTFAEILRECRVFLQTQVKSSHSSVKVADIDFREERNFGFRSEVGSATEADFYHLHYLEKMEDEPTLYKLMFFWRYMKNCESDYNHEGAVLVKKLMEKSGQDFNARLTALKWHRLPSGTFLNRLELHDPHERTKIQF